MKPTKFSLNEAAIECGRAKSTISKAIARGDLSAKNISNNPKLKVYEIDPAELFRVFPKKTETEKKKQAATTKKLMKNANENSTEMLIDYAKMEVELRLLREQKEKDEHAIEASRKQLETAQENFQMELEQARKERDEWMKQAKTSNLLLENHLKSEEEGAKTKKGFWFFGGK